MEYLLRQNDNLKQISKHFTKAKLLRPRQHQNVNLKFTGNDCRTFTRVVFTFIAVCLCVFWSTLHRITQVRKPGPGPQADGSKWLREPKPAKRQQRQHSPFSLCFTSPCSTMGDIMQLVEHLIKAGFCFPVWQDKLLCGVNLRVTFVSTCLEFLGGVTT